MRLVLCDDQRLLCEALATALAERDHQVLAVTTTATAGVTAVAAHHPDVCLLDLCFPDAEDGLDAARAIAQHHPGTKVLVLSGISDPQILSEAMDIGVAGLIPKDQTLEEIANALDVIAAGGQCSMRASPRCRFPLSGGSDPSAPWTGSRRGRRRSWPESSPERAPSRWPVP